ncbi:TetR/AcrR family transcriptional regulator [Nonomuraea africana]|uniref:AcrR family transcriptional regulator n=1 Tax=Nonomuraea africana TaxID=46171 RepID=A0ABR9KEV1_9ACTN|nr:TetR/AcrR family transcriptional regulator [Nonomuraea africana]MBE1560551.1 AcrR family transcriptional regulator [Nonomuraea africana]
MRDDTRAKIQEIALRLFTEQGYEATSLREIAEELGVTKAALYYHFKTKDDIVASLAEMRVAETDELLSWARSQPKTAETRRELVSRYAAQLERSRHQEITRFLERNQTALRDHPTIHRMRERMIEVSDELSSPDDPLDVKLRGSIALFTLHAGMWLTQHYDVTDDERRATAKKVALEILEGHCDD